MRFEPRDLWEILLGVMGLREWRMEERVAFVLWHQCAALLCSGIVTESTALAPLPFLNHCWLAERGWCGRSFAFRDMYRGIRSVERRFRIGLWFSVGVRCPRGASGLGLLVGRRRSTPLVDLNGGGLGLTLHSGAAERGRGLS